MSKRDFEQLSRLKMYHGGIYGGITVVFIYSNHPPTNCINSQGHNHVSKLDKAFFNAS